VRAASGLRLKGTILFTCGTFYIAINSHHRFLIFDFCSAKRSLKRIPMIKLELVQQSCKNELNLIYN
jgi:hypothetical protein